MDHDSFCAQAWDDHASQPEAVAARLPAGAALVQSPAQAAAHTRLAAHVLGEHLGRWADALAHLAPLQAQAEGDPAAHTTVQRHRRALQAAAGDMAALSAAGLDRSEHIATQALAAGLLASIDPDRALALYAAAQTEETTQPLPDTDPAVRTLASNGHNIAAGLEERPARAPAQTAGMLAAAEAALRHWARAGGWLERERAHWQLARCQLAAGDAAAAHRSATDGLAVCQAHAAPAFEAFFLHVVRARAAAALADATALAHARQAALDALAQVPADQRVWCQPDLELLQCLS